MMPGGSHHKSTHKNFHQLTEYASGNNVGVVSVRALWFNFSATFLCCSVANIVLYKTCMT